MQVNESTQGEYLVVEVLETRLDARISLAIKNYLMQKYESEIFNLIIDLSSVNFIDSSALGAFVTALKLLGNRGVMLLVGVNENVLEIFRLTRMDRIFKIYPTTEMAIEEAPLV